VRGEPAGAGFRVERHASLPSTNDAAREAAQLGEPEGLLVLAAEQTAGKGRHGRAWASPAGNLHASLLLRPRVPLAEAATVSLVVALAVADAASRVLDDPDRVRVKWPNDVLLDGAKLAGVLLEGGDDGAGGCAWLVAGVGLNLAHAPGPGEVPYAAAALAGAGPRLAPDEFLGLWLPEMRYRLDAWAAGGFAALRGDWLGRAHGLGRPASLRLGGELVRGRFADLGEDGSVLIENELGCLARYSAGELFFP
jgi:BirA family transcriptional regulator, biotin operon repressor / biotin---[acetyl-CoA-carboxylase] ligase